MQVGQIGGVGDFGKFALLRHLMKDRRLAVCWYLTGESDETKDRDRHFDYLKRPDDFRHFAPEVFDQLVEFDGGSRALIDPLTDLHMSRILGDAVFLRQEVPRQSSIAPSSGSTRSSIRCAAPTSSSLIRTAGYRGNG